MAIPSPLRRNGRQCGVLTAGDAMLDTTVGFGILPLSESPPLSPQGRRDPGDLHLPREVYLPLLQQARHAYFSKINWTRALFDDAAVSGIKVSTDLHDWDGEDSCQHEFVMRTDQVFVSTSVRCDAVMQHGRAEAVIAMGGVAAAALALPFAGARRTLSTRRTDEAR